MANPVFDLLTGEDVDDVEALAAYALYKKHKRAWADEFRRENGSAPGPAEDAAFARVAATKDQLDRYRKDARDILIAFANDTLERARPEIEQEAITARIERAAEEAAAQSTFPKQVLVGLVATLINTAILIILALGIRFAGIDLLEMIESVEPGQVESLGAPEDG